MQNVQYASYIFMEVRVGVIYPGGIRSLSCLEAGYICPRYIQLATRMHIADSCTNILDHSLTINAKKP